MMKSYGNRKLKYFLIFILLIFFNGSSSMILSQNKYDINFDAQWSWEDLFSKAASFNPGMITKVEQLKSRITISDARIVLKFLSALDSLNMINDLSMSENKTSEDSVLSNSGDVNFTEDFEGLIDAALFVASLRKVIPDGKFNFTGREYLMQPADDQRDKISLTFNYDGAGKVLNYFEGMTGLSEAAYSEPFRISPRTLMKVSNAELESFLEASADRDPGNILRMWIDPSLYLDFAGVYLFRDNFKNVLSELKLNEDNIRADISSNLSRYLPENVFLNTQILYSFGKTGPVVNTGDNRLIVNLEYFGDDYGYLTGKLQHELFLQALGEMQLPVEVYAVQPADRKFVKLLTDIVRKGTANYAGPVGTETRPWFLLEKDFELFTRIYKSIYQNSDGVQPDSLIIAGTTGDSPLYTMVTQMSYIIETTLGRNAFIESVNYGPVYFFNKYVEAYKEYPEKIRSVFTFAKNIENKLSSLQKLFPSATVSEALKLKTYRNDPYIMKNNVVGFINNAANVPLSELLGGYLLLEAKDYISAKEYFMNQILNDKDKGRLAGDVADLFVKYGGVEEPLEFYNLYVTESPADPSAYEKRGIYYYMNGQNDLARNDFEKALVINSGCPAAKKYLDKLSTGTDN